jgi:hypothetical protein
MIAQLKNYGIIIGIMMLMMRCATYTNVYSNYDRSIDFSVYKTFAWAPDSGEVVSKDMEAYDNDIVRNNVKNYVNFLMTERGYLINIDSPDVILSLALLNEKKESIVTYHDYPYPYARYYYYNRYYFPYYYPHYRYYTWYGWVPPYYYGPSESRTYTKTYVKGTITLNMYDRKLKKLIWTGSAEGDIYDPKYIQYDVHPAIDRIMKKFPVTPEHRPKINDQLYHNRVVRMYDVNSETDNNSSFP